MKIAIVGAGISGLTAAYLLNRKYEITVYEANDYIGGHTNTIDVSANGGTFAVDTGFIVFNEKTYPNFVKLLKKIGVQWQKSTMSFSVKCLKTGLEFSPSTPGSLFVQKRNLHDPKFYRMLLDAIRFRRQAKQLIVKNSGYQKTLSEFLKENKYSEWFADYFIVPMGAAIWSSDPDRFGQFPVRYFAEFFENHGILNVRNQPQWLVVKNGSRQYIRPLTREFSDRIRTNSPVSKIARHERKVVVETEDGQSESYDYVVVATHSDQALSLLADPSYKEREILGSIKYQENETILHTDHSLLPENRKAWASWNYLVPASAMGKVALTYYMNLLQNIEAKEHFCVTLNLSEAIAPEKRIRTFLYHHPVYTPISLDARNRRAEINGVDRTFYCGAYWYYGFHEDGVKSALDVAESFGIKNI